MTVRNLPLPKTAASGMLLATTALAGAAIFNRQMAKTAERKHPPEGQFLTVDGVRLHYVDSGGDKSPVVLLHGNGTMIADMAISGLLERVSRQHRTIAFDRPGFGYSTVRATKTGHPRIRHRSFARPLLGSGLRSHWLSRTHGAHWLHSRLRLTKTPSVVSY